MHLCTIAISILLACASAYAGEFQPPAVYPSDMYPWAVATADFNHDGKKDLAVASIFNTTVDVLLGNGDGTFQSQVQYPGSPSGAYEIAVADLNNDGAADLVTAGPSGASVFLGNGDGSFQPYVTYPTGDTNTAVTIGDFNHDGYADLALPRYGNFVSVLLGNGDGTFGPPRQYTTASYAVDIVSGDFNRDGNLDLATADNSSFVCDDRVSVLLGNGDGTFQKNMDYTVAESCPEGIATGDLNHDGALDLVATSGLSVSVLLGVGDGTFHRHVDYSVGLVPGAVAIADFNADGKPDLAIANNYISVVSVLLGKGDGTFQPHVDYPAGSGAQSLAIADFNHDGATDIVTGNAGSHTVSTLLNSGRASVTLTSSVNPSAYSQPVTFTVQVTATFSSVGTPNGTVTFKDGAITLGTVPLTSGRAQFTTSTLNAGDHKIRARYLGDGVFNPQNAPGLIQKVRP